jgi:CubicO group peptidase (beta-lactamase class C family)
MADPQSVTLAELVLHRGEIVHEAYGPDTGPDTTLISWSTGKSVTHALVGVAVRDGLADLDAPAPVREWAGDERSAITLRQLLNMTSGLRFVEDYVDDSVSHCIDMLFGEGHTDVAHYAASLPLDHPPGSTFNYSSGTTNIVSRAVGQAVGGGEAGMRAFMEAELFGPLGMTSADPRFDAAGTFVGSSFLYCTTRDFARFGQLWKVPVRDVLPPAAVPDMTRWFVETACATNKVEPDLLRALNGPLAAHLFEKDGALIPAKKA